MSLYEHWQQTRERFGDAMALRDGRADRSWTFDAIQTEVDRLPASGGRVAFPAGFSVSLIFETLRAWRDGAVLCPVEKAGAEPEAALFEKLPPEVRHVKLTSGSTGAPRLVLFEGGALAADARKIVSTMGLRPEWPNLGVISMAHSYGFSNLVLPLLLHGIPLVWLGDPLPGAVGEALAGGGAEPRGWTLPAVPAMWRAWHEGGALSDRVRLAISAGSPLPVDLEAAIFARSGVKVHNFYGSSECGGIAYDRSETPRAAPGATGTAMDETALSVNDDGCLEVRGPSVGLGYWPPEGETESGDDAATRLGDGVFVTSDLAAIDPVSGAVALAGRRDDLINVAGRKISPARVESAIARVEGVRHAVVFGVPSPVDTRGEEIVAVVNFRGHDSSPAEAEFRELVRAATESLAPHEAPRHWHFQADLVPDARGKISRHRWRERFLREPGSR
ncbi:MAG: long-chain fatty acid--CoA ligase [Verrucomicrobiae bacterium]|nr:long-chain fatty acid--CoA ligase [Verrucomicrobiae bacterium]MCP5550257.1 long-chain fatty acid--CoA ligase [Akkermansiaceae bacterium]